MSTENAAPRSTPRAGDVAYYAPWGNLAVFYRDFRSSPGLIKLGRLDGDLAAFPQAGPITVTTERDTPPTTGRSQP